MAYTQTDIDKLKEAIASGAREVWYGDKRVAYRSLAEMEEILGKMQEEVSGKKICRTRRVTYSKGA